MQPFIEFLRTQGVIRGDAGAVGNIGKVREPLGSIAFSYGLLSADDVDLILTEQRRQHRPFGEIACAMGVLTTAQVEALVRIQALRSATETVEALALAGCAPHEQLIDALGRYLTKGGAGSQRLAA